MKVENFVCITFYSCPAKARVQCATESQSDALWTFPKKKEIFSNLKHDSTVTSMQDSCSFGFSYLWDVFKVKMFHSSKKMKQWRGWTASRQAALPFACKVTWQLRCVNREAWGTRCPLKTTGEKHHYTDCVCCRKRLCLNVVLLTLGV